MTATARCACGEYAPIRLVKWYHGIDADMCEACFKKHQLMVANGMPVERLNYRFSTT